MGEIERGMGKKRKKGGRKGGEGCIMAFGGMDAPLYNSLHYDHRQIETNHYNHVHTKIQRTGFDRQALAN